MFELSAIALFILASIFLLVLWAYWSFQRQVKGVGGMPGPHQALSLHNPLGMLLPASLQPHDYKMAWKARDYNYLFGKYQSNVVAVVSMGERNIFVADAELIQSITAQAKLFPKPTHIYTALDLLGKNVVTTEGMEWKRHRKIASPSFSERNNRLVHEQTLFHLQAMMDDWRLQAKNNNASSSNNQLAGKQLSTSICVNETMMLLTALIICGAGMGLPITWSQRYEPTGTHRLSLLKALEIVSHTALTRALTPAALIPLLPGQSWRELEVGWSEFEGYLRELIRDARARILQQKEEGSLTEDPRDHDVLTALMHASLAEMEESNHTTTTSASLTESEIIGNIFIFLIAGHETTAHTLMFALTLLALYPDVQERLHQELTTVLASSSSPTTTRLPTYEDFNRLSYTQAVIWETLRLFPPVVAIPKQAAEDVTMNGYAVAKGAYVHLHVAGMQRHPGVWGSDANQFRPERFLKGGSKSTPAPSAATDSSSTSSSGTKTNAEWQENGEDSESTSALEMPRKGLLPFSLGIRSCLGKRFAQVESVCTLATLVQRYRILPDLAKMGLPADCSRERMEAHMLEAKSILTLIPVHDIWLRLEERGSHYSNMSTQQQTAI